MAAPTKRPFLDSDLSFETCPTFGVGTASSCHRSHIAMRSGRLHHPHRPCTNLGCKLVRRLAHTGSTYSEVRASSKPGAVRGANLITASEPLKQRVIRIIQNTVEQKCLNFVPAIFATHIPTEPDRIPIPHWQQQNDLNCSPLNILGEGNASAAAVAYSFGTSTQRTVIKQHVLSLNAQGDLFSLTTEPVSAAVGVEFRRDSVDARSDPISRGLGFYINTGTNLVGRSDVWEGYAEVNAPILRQSAVGELLDLNGAIRRTEYGVQGNRFLANGTTESSAGSFAATTWKLGVVYEPIRSLRFRVARSRDIRAPNIAELYFTETAVVAAVNGITVSRRTGGNPDLKPEIADTWTLGAVLTPSIIPGLNISLDYFDIKVKNAISTLGVTTIVNGCSSGNQTYCSLITFTGSTPSIVRDPNFNVAQLAVRGIDFEAGYRFNMMANSKVDLRFLATRNLKYVAADGIDRVGQTGVQTQALAGVPAWTLNGNATVESGKFGFTAQGRFISAGKYDATLLGPEDAGYVNTAANAWSTNRVASRFYLDLNLRYTIVSNGARRAQLFFGVQNVFDRDPPLAPSNAIATNPIFFDTFGRRFTGGIRFGL